MEVKDLDMGVLPPTLALGNSMAFLSAPQARCPTAEPVGPASRPCPPEPLLIWGHISPSGTVNNPQAGASLAENAKIKVPPVSGESSGDRWLPSPRVLTWQRDRQTDRRRDGESETKKPSAVSHKNTAVVRRTAITTSSNRLPEPPSPSPITRGETASAHEF